MENTNWHVHCPGNSDKKCKEKVMRENQNMWDNAYKKKFKKKDTHCPRGYSVDTKTGKTCKQNRAYSLDNSKHSVPIINQTDTHDNEYPKYDSFYSTIYGYVGGFFGSKPKTIKHTLHGRKSSIKSIPACPNGWTGKKQYVSRYPVNDEESKHFRKYKNRILKCVPEDKDNKSTVPGLSNPGNYIYSTKNGYVNGTYDNRRPNRKSKIANIPPCPKGYESNLVPNASYGKGGKYKTYVRHCIKKEDFFEGGNEMDAESLEDENGFENMTENLNHANGFDREDMYDMSRC